MNASLTIRIYKDQQLHFSEEFAEPVELGRQSEGEPEPFTKTLENGRWRTVIARLDERTISRKHARLEALSVERARLTNLSTTLPIHLADGVDLRPRLSCELNLPAVMTLGDKEIRVDALDRNRLPRQEGFLEEVTRPPGFMTGASFRFPTLGARSDSSIDSEEFVRWLETAMDLLHSAASSGDFFQKAVQAVVEMIDLDSGRLLLLDQGEWKAEALQTAPRVTVEANWQPSRQVLNHVCQQKRTFWQLTQSGLEGTSLAGVQAVVAAPILDRNGEVIGALYGDRRQRGRSLTALQITKLEAKLVELLARGVATGLARLEQEKAAMRARVQLEQFFPPELAEQLSAKPDLLKGKDCEVTVLFADIRDFSRISERLRPAVTVEWVRDVLVALSEVVLAHGGATVEYIGDEVLAMWGAPDEQPDHASRACRAALAMLEEVPRLNARWQATLQEPLRLGIGIHTGVARVGNIGPPHKFRYGPLGNTVNVASRVQGATKYLKSTLLLTGATHAQLDGGFHTRRLCRVGVINIAEPVDLYELVAEGQPGWHELQGEYEKALEEFERKDFLKAISLLSKILCERPDDGPALVLMSRIAPSLGIRALSEEGGPFDPVLRLPGK